MAEIGIGFGLHAKELLKNTELSMLYLVDPMAFYPNDSFAIEVAKTIPKGSEGPFEELVELIKHELAPWSDRWCWLRKPSQSILMEEIADGSLDCVFVDGDHSYNAVKGDLEFWWRKVRVGGMMLGDDYWMPEVERAVQEFATEHGLPLTFAENPTNPTYKIFQFMKV